LCRELEADIQAKLDQKDFRGVRGLLEQARGGGPIANCVAGLRTRYDRAVASSVEDLRASARSAMEKQNYVTPEAESALHYVRLTLNVDPQDAESKVLEADIFTRAWDQAQARANARQHQEALDIYQQLKRHYPSPPVGAAALEQAIEKQQRQVALLKTLRVPISVGVRHPHGRNILLRKRECMGVLRVDGFTIEYQTSDEHAFKLAYSGLKDSKLDKTKLLIQGVGVPDGKIELEQSEKSSTPSLAELYAKLLDFRKLQAEYLK
jgi:hypothetical protein